MTSSRVFRGTKPKLTQTVNDKGGALKLERLPELIRFEESCHQVRTDYVILLAGLHLTKPVIDVHAYVPLMSRLRPGEDTVWDSKIKADEGGNQDDQETLPACVKRKAYNGRGEEWAVWLRMGAGEAGSASNWKASPHPVQQLRRRRHT